MEQAAKIILQNARAMVPGQFKTMRATPVTHPHVDWKAYQAVRANAASLGFRHLGDVDVTSVHQDPSMMKRAVLAVFVGKDGTEVVGHYRVVLRWTFKGILGRLMGVRGDIFDVGTSFGGGEGVMLETTSAQAAAVWDMPDFVRRETFEKGTPLGTLVKRHRERVREYRDQHPDDHPTVVHTLDQVFAVADRTEARKLAWRRQLGWASRDELGRITKTSGDALDRLEQAFRELAAAAADR